MSDHECERHRIRVAYLSPGWVASCAEHEWQGDVRGSYGEASTDGVIHREGRAGL